MNTRYDVAIVGAGPTGVALAIALGQRGRRVAVLERHRGIYPLPRAVHLDEEVYRILHGLGVGGAFAAITQPTAGLRLVDRQGRVLAQFERHAASASGLPEANMFDQPELEQVLRDELARQPSVDLVEDVEIVDVQADGEGAVTTGRTLATGAEVTVHSAFVVGCDGANSRVAERIGSAWVDLGFEQSWLVVDVRCARSIGDWDGVHQVCDGRRAGTFMRVRGDRYRWEFELRDGESPDAFAELSALRALIDPWVERVPDDELELLRCAAYTFRARVRDRWRSGRLLLAGDAAHLTPPFIGQGLCAGLRDAANLAWKLDRALGGEATDELIASYETERRPHATAMVRKAILVGWVMNGGGALGALVRRWLLPAVGRLPGLAELVLDSTSPAFGVGPLVSREVPARARGALVPLVRVERDGASVLVDERLGAGFAIIAREAADTAAIEQRWPGPVLRVDARSPCDGLRSLASWLDTLRADAVIARPDRTVLAVARRGRMWPASVSALGPG